MNSNDLFSFLDDVPMGNDNDESIDEEIQQVEPRIPKKRKANIPAELVSSNGDLMDNEPGPSAYKKPRMASPKPVVVDEFETEAKREVAASAGLTGGVEAGSRLELRHQVCFSCAALNTVPSCHVRSATKSLSHRVTTISLFHNTYPPPNPRESTNSIWIPFNKFLFMLYNGTRVF
jgi:hypothetical protein